MAMGRRSPLEGARLRCSQLLRQLHASYHGAANLCDFETMPPTLLPTRAAPVPASSSKIYASLPVHGCLSGCLSARRRHRTPQAGAVVPSLDSGGGSGRWSWGW